MKSYDAIIIGAGSVGVPLAWKLAEQKVKVLVLETHGTHGQGQNKAAIGGVRATHSDPREDTDMSEIAGDCLDVEGAVRR